MNNLIVPCAGKSSRFPKTRPKYLLTHPSGKLMIEKSLEGLDLNDFDRFIITILKAHDEKYDSSLILRQIFGHLKNFEILILNDTTKSQSETIMRTIVNLQLSGSLVIKDSDNKVTLNRKKAGNFVVGFDVSDKNIERLPSKSFLKTNEQMNIIDIVEKKIISSVICVGVYGFESIKDFYIAYEALENNLSQELYVSAIVSYLINVKNKVFNFLSASTYEDYGTLKDWNIVREKYKTYFVDFDGVIVENVGKYGAFNWSNSMTPILENINILKKIKNSGNQIIITTSREEQYREKIYDFLSRNGFIPDQIVTDLYHSKRIIINDFSASNPFPTAISINIPRNSNLDTYLDEN